MIDHCRNDLETLKHLLSNIDSELYAYTSKSLGGSTIGAHIRHILEFYISVVNSSGHMRINYDNRARDKQLETDPNAAISTIDLLCSLLCEDFNDEQVYLECNYTINNGSDCDTVLTSRYRELAYNLEHSIHHQALIRVALRELNREHLVGAEFGVAPSTIRYYD